MSIEVRKRLWIVVDDGVQVQGLRVRQIRVWHRLGNSRPVRRNKSTQGRGIVPCAEIVEAGFGVPLLAVKFVRVAAGRANGALPAVGIEVAVVLNGSTAVG